MKGGNPPFSISSSCVTIAHYFISLIKENHEQKKENPPYYRYYAYS